MDPNFSHLKDKPILNIKRKIKFTVTRLIAMTYLKIQNIEVFKKRDFQFLVLHVRSLVVATLSKQVKIWTNWKTNHSSCIHNTGEDKGQTGTRRTGETVGLIIQSCGLPEQRPRSENTMETSAVVGTPTVIDKLLETQCGQDWQNSRRTQV